jgi:hypothetical protein
MSESEKLPPNWGRWGEHDERGTLNLITAEVRARAVAEARSGRTVSISRPMPTSPIVAGSTAPLGADSVGVMQAALFTGASPRGTAELVMMLTHHPEVTHFDSLVHQVVDGMVYRGSRSRRPVARPATGTGPLRCSHRAWSPAASSPIWPPTARCRRATG